MYLKKRRETSKDPLTFLRISRKVGTLIFMSPAVTEVLDIDASNVALYDMVADVTRMGEWSPEATGARADSRQMTSGDRFVGFNKHGFARWFTFNTVRRAQRGELFEFDTDFGPFAISRWRYTFTPLDDGRTRVAETWWDRRTGPLSLPVRAMGQIFIPGDREQHNRTSMITTLQRLRGAAEIVS